MFSSVICTLDTPYHNMSLMAEIKNFGYFQVIEEIILLGFFYIINSMSVLGK